MAGPATLETLRDTLRLAATLLEAIKPGAIRSAHQQSVGAGGPRPKCSLRTGADAGRWVSARSSAPRLRTVREVSA